MIQLTFWTTYNYNFKSVDIVAKLASISKEFKDLYNNKTKVFKKDINAVRQPMRAPTSSERLKIPMKSPIAARNAVISKPPSWEYLVS